MLPQPCVSGSVVTVTPIVGGSATITVTAQDSDGFSATQTIAVTVNTALGGGRHGRGGDVDCGKVCCNQRCSPSNFNDPDNDSLTYTASSSAPAVATVSVSGSVVTVTPVAGGSTTITVTAQDPGGFMCDPDHRGHDSRQSGADGSRHVRRVATFTLAWIPPQPGMWRPISATQTTCPPDLYGEFVRLPDVATATVSGSVVTVTPIVGGSATITPDRASRSDGFSATQTIAVATVNTMRFGGGRHGRGGDVDCGKVCCNQRCERPTSTIRTTTL